MTSLNDVLRYRVVPVIVLDEVASAEPLGQALVDGGLPVAEVTLRTDSAIESIRIMAQDERLIVGAGTVTTAQQVDSAAEAGASFLVSPGLSEAVVRRAEEVGLPILPGAVTASEVMRASDLGIEVVKFFPASTSGGARAIAALAAPFPAIGFVPTGGVNGANALDYLAIQAVRAVGGSWMVPREAIRARDVATLTTSIVDAIAALPD